MKIVYGYFSLEHGRLKFDNCHVTLHCVRLEQSRDNCQIIHYPLLFIILRS